MKSVSGFRKYLLSSSCIGATAAVLALYAAPAAADCPVPAGGTCQWGGSGAAGTPAPSSGAPSNGSGHNGGPGGAGPSGWLNIDSLNWVGDAGNQLSPIDLRTYGGTGAQGSDATAGLDGKGGGSGGTGGDGGDLTITTGSGMSGTTVANVTGISIYTIGGAGGAGASANLNTDDSQNGVGGTGGRGGALILDLDGKFPNNLNNQSRSLEAVSGGGGGGAGRDWNAGLNEDGVYAGAGGDGGVLTAILRGAFVGDEGGAYLMSQGGGGGKGGKAEDFTGAIGGRGGAGGNGQAVAVTVTGTASLGTYASSDAGLTVLSHGGWGGLGGEGPSGGAAGAGGAAGNVTVALQGGKVATFGQTASVGVLAQSLGGNGGDGGAAAHGVIGPNGGAGSVGGAAGSVAVTGGGLITIVTGMSSGNGDPTDYGYSPGILAQSVGGGGGGGADSAGWFSVGGDGGNGVNGASASVDVQANITTWGTSSDGIAVQSIGGGGGKGGDAKGSGVEVNMVIGGTGGGGGDGDAVSARLQQGSAIQTAGSHAHGVLVQSIGGGGGAGGAAYSKSTNLLYGASISLGGSGGDGGDGNTVAFATGASTTNAGRIFTKGADSYGVIGQSIGGGGGIGGASTAISKTYSEDDYPGLSMTLAMGGSGGAGGKGDSVTLDSSGLILTSGSGAIGLIGQSVGGGGGAGGDASSTSTATGGEVNVSANLTFGGKAGTGNHGGIGAISNSGFIITTGESADGMLVQSIGGGGGAGGAGDGKSTASSGTSISASLTMGGSSGGGGDGQTVTATNAGSIITLGDSAFGVGAQSIGGGGGRGGGAAGSATGDYTATVTLGGSGGNGGNAGDADAVNKISTVTIANKAGATIVTFGADANGVIAQSIGGGGGAAGKSASNISTKKSTNDGGNGDAAGTPSTMSALSSAFDASGLAGLSSYGGLNGAIVAINSLLAINAPTSQLGDAEGDLDDTAQSKGDTDDSNSSSSINISVAVGGKGGSGGDAGAVVINNDGEVATMGHHADAIVGMSIGGGGGKGGAASTAASDDNKNGNLSIGGSGGSGGSGGGVNITNTGDIYTKGALSAGIVGQSIAGGGGIGGVSASSISASSKKSGDADANDGAFKSLQISVGGNGGASSATGEIAINNSGAISTAAHDSIGIIAQSITGGGGIVKTLATDQEGAGGAASATGTKYDINFKFGGSNGGGGQGAGLVNVTTTAGGTITTKGRNSYGILAQSIAGHGGLALGGNPVGSSASNFFGSGATPRANANRGMTIDVGADIATSGAGGIGVFAQSIGGGGGIAGDTGNSEQFWTMSGMTNLNGDGGSIAVTLEQGASIQTWGANAPAMFLQSIGGGGGRITNEGGAYIGAAGGSGVGGVIDVTINGTVAVWGEASLGIFAQSVGDSTSNSPIKITVGSSGSVQGGGLFNNSGDITPAIYIDHGGKDASTANVVTNNGAIGSIGGVNGTAVYSAYGYTAVINNKDMTGDIHLLNNGGSGCFTNNGNFNAGDQITLGACALTNNGTMSVGGAAQGTTTIVGDYAGRGTLVFDADFAGGVADRLIVEGDAIVGDTITVNATSISNRSVKLLSVAGALTLAPGLAAADDSHLYDFKTLVSGSDVSVTPVANFTAKASAYGRNERVLAANLQTLFDSGVSADATFTRLLGVADDASYAAGLKSLAGQGLGAFGAFRFNSSRTFASKLYGGCQDLQLESRAADRCVWGQVLVNGVTQKAGTDELGYEADAFVSQMGVQLPVSGVLALTGSLAYESTEFRGGDGSARVTGDSLIGGLGLLFTPAQWEFSAGIDAAYGWYKSERKITLGFTEQVSAKPEQAQMGVHVRAAVNLLENGESFVRPFAEGHAIRVSNKAFTETGASPFRLAVDAEADTALIGVAGLEVGTKLMISSKIALRPFASVALEYGRPRDWTTTARFAERPQDGRFDLKTAGPETLGRLSIGADLLSSKSVKFSIEYSPEVGKDFTSHSGTARLSILF